MNNDSVTFVAMLQTQSPLKSVMLQKTFNFNWLDCSMTQFCITVPTRKL